MLKRSVFIGVLMSSPVLADNTSVTDWSGVYGGFQFSIWDGTDRGNVGNNANTDGTIAGAFVGYRYDFGSIVAGLEVDYNKGALNFTGVPGNPGPLGTGTVRWSADVTSYNMEIGYDAGDVLVSGIFGWAKLDSTFNGTKFSDTGRSYGIGADYSITDNFTVGAEILRHDMPDFFLPNNDVTFTLYGLNIAYNF